MSDFLAELQHSWGKSAKQKAREKEYNAEYYRKNKEKWEKYHNEIAPYGVANLRTNYEITQDRQAAEDRYNTAVKVKKQRRDDATFLNEQRLQNNFLFNDPKADREFIAKAQYKYKQAEDNEKNAKAELIKARRREADADKATTEKAKLAKSYAQQAYVNQLKEYKARRKEEADAKNPVKSFTKNFKSNWKLGAQEIKNSAQKGASFVANLFKK